MPNGRNYTSFILDDQNRIENFIGQISSEMLDYIESNSNHSKFVLFYKHLTHSDLATFGKAMIALYQFLEYKENYILFRKAVLIDQIIYDKIVDTYKHSNTNLLDLIINMNIDNVSRYALHIKNIIQNKSLYDKKQLFEELINIIFKDSSFKSLERLRALKDIIINSEEEDELEIINNLMLEDPNDKIMGVNLMTIHKAKGLEFKCVFLISLNDGILPSNIKNNDLLEEERRLCYVGITRAKEFLYLSSSEYHIINGIRKRLQPSLFISEIRN